jgi:hypothetical protein
MAKTLQRKAIKRTGKLGQKALRGRPSAADFCVRARAALERGEPDAIPDKMLQQVLAAAVKVYGAKVERRGHDVAPFPPGSVTATETVVMACGLIRAADLNMFDVAIWFHRPPGIE